MRVLLKTPNKKFKLARRLTRPANFERFQTGFQRLARNSKWSAAALIPDEYLGGSFEKLLHQRWESKNGTGASGTSHRRRWIKIGQAEPTFPKRGWKYRFR